VRRGDSGGARLMPRLLMVGLSHHAAPLDVRERVVIDEATWRLHAPDNVCTVLLSTCNRLEIYAWIDDRAQAQARLVQRRLAKAARIPLAELKPYLKTAVGAEALLHLAWPAASTPWLWAKSRSAARFARRSARPRRARTCQPRCAASSNAPVNRRGEFAATHNWAGFRRSLRWV